MSVLSTLTQVLGLGKVADNSHPIHPATVHFPIAFLSLGYGVDTLHGLTTHYDISALHAVVPYLADISKVAYLSNLLGIITAVPSALTGVSELYAMISSKGIWQKIKKQSTGETPGGLNVALSAAMLPSLMFSACWGGTMVYKYGVGVMRTGEAARIKEDMGKDEVKRSEGQTQILERKDQ